MQIIKDWRGYLSERKTKTHPSYPASTNFSHRILSCPSQFPSCPCQKYLPLQELYCVNNFTFWLLGPHSAQFPILITLLPQPSLSAGRLNANIAHVPSWSLLSLLSHWAVLSDAWLQPRPSSMLQTQRPLPVGHLLNPLRVPQSQKSQNWTHFPLNYPKLPLLHCFPISNGSGTETKTKGNILDSSPFLALIPYRSQSPVNCLHNTSYPCLLFILLAAWAFLSWRLTISWRSCSKCLSSSLFAIHLPQAARDLFKPWIWQVTLLLKIPPLFLLDPVRKS